MTSATQTGLLPPSRSTIAVIVIWRPPSNSSTCSTSKLVCTREPDGSGAGKRTRFRP